MECRVVHTVEKMKIAPETWRYFFSHQLALGTSLIVKGVDLMSVDDWNDMLRISSDILAGIDRKTSKEMYRRGRSDEEFDSLYEKAKEYRKERDREIAKDSIKRMINRYLEEGLSLDEIQEIVDSFRG